MQIREIAFQADQTPGLNDIHMTRLGRTVALFGPNGAGKSRLMRTVYTAATQARERNDTSFFSVAPKETDGIAQLGFPRSIPETFGRASMPEIQRAFEPFCNPQRCRGYFDSEEVILYDAMAYFDYHRKHPEFDHSKFQVELRCVDRVKELAKQLMDVDFGYVLDGTVPLPAFNRRPLRQGELSGGQRFLLSLMVMLLDPVFAELRNDKQLAWKGALLFVDELEGMLHPGALVQVFEMFRELVGPEGQIWIATHSLSMLAVLNDDEIWTVHKGSVQHPGAEQIERAVQLLVGSEERSDRFRACMAAPDEWAATKFVAECLVNPEKVALAANDPQLAQLLACLKSTETPQSAKRIIDIGAGRGRLASLLRGSGLTDYQYLPIEPDQSMHENVRESAGELLDPEWGIISEIKDVPGKFANAADVAVMCNVLHEIPVREWARELERVKVLLKDDGLLVVCEDQLIPIGERPHRLGFLVMGEGELQMLFGLKDKPPTFMHPDPRYRDRLLCAGIKASAIQITGESVRNAVAMLKGRMVGEVKEMRAAKRRWTAKDGRRYGFLSQMLINAEFAASEI